MKGSGLFLPKLQFQLARNGRERTIGFKHKPYTEGERLRNYTFSQTGGENDHSCQCGPCTHLLFGQQIGCVCDEALATVCNYALIECCMG